MDELGLRSDYTSPNVFDDATADSDPGGYAGMGKGLISSEKTGGAGYGAGYDSEEGLRSTGSKPSGDSWLHDFAEDLSSPFIPGGTGYGPTNQEFQRLEQEESGATGGEDAGTSGDASGSAGSENERSYTRTNPDGTVDVVKGDTMFHWDPTTNEVTETNTTTGEKTTTSPDDTPSLFGIPDPEIRVLASPVSLPLAFFYLQPHLSGLFLECFLMISSMFLSSTSPPT